jgi:hypothetical protein
MKKRLLLAGLILLLALPLALLLHDFVREIFVVEFLRFLWALRLLFESIPQLLWWGSLLLAVAAVAIRSLGLQRKQRRRLAAKEPAPGGPVQDLARRIQRAATGDYFRWSLGVSLADLIWEVMAQRERTTPEDVRRRFETGSAELPPAVEAYLRSVQAPHYSASAGLLTRIWHRLRSPSAALHPDVALQRVVEFLEEQLEVVHDPTGG